MATGSIQVLSRAIALLRALRQSEASMTLGQLATHIDLPKSTVQRLVSTLIEEGLVRPAKRTRGFRLGPGFYALNVQRDEDVCALIRPLLHELSEQTGETVDLAAYKNHSLVFIDQVPGKARLRAISAVGDHFPLTSTANGHTILRLLPEAERQKIYQRENLPDQKRFELEHVLAAQKDPWFGEDLENKDAGICAIGFGFKFFDVGHYAISVICPASRFEDKHQKIVACLKQTTEALEKYGIF